MLTLDLAKSDRPPDFATGVEVNVWRDERGDVCARLFRGAASRWIEWPGLGLFWFEPRGRVVYVRPAPEARAEIVQDTFARVLQPAILQALGWQALHASAVAGSAGVLAFCGTAQAGKSTLAYALGQTGFRHVADDALVVSLEAGEVRGHPLPFTARLRPAAQRHFDAASGTLGPPSDAPASARVAAFFLLKQDPSCQNAPRPERVPPARAFTDLMTHAHCFDAADQLEARRLVEDFLEIVETVPVFSLVYRPGFERLAALRDAVAEVHEGAMDSTALAR
jgi:hypothetical protein